MLSHNKYKEIVLYMLYIPRKESPRFFRVHIFVVLWKSEKPTTIPQTTRVIRKNTHIKNLNEQGLGFRGKYSVGSEEMSL